MTQPQRSDDDSSPDDIEFGIRRSRHSTTSHRRFSSALYPGQFMTMEFCLANAELSLSMAILLSIVAILLATHRHRYEALLAHWQRLNSASAQVIESLVEMTRKIKREFAHIVLLIRWVTMHGEMALLYAEDLRYFVRVRRHRFKEIRYRKINEISSDDCDAWFRASPHHLRQLLIHWRVPLVFRNSTQGSTSLGEECFLVFLFHLIKGVPFTEMARHTFGGDPRRFSSMFDHMEEHLYFTFYNKITGTSMSQWIPQHLDTCRRLIHNALSDGAIFETEYVNGEVVDRRWIHHHFDFDSFRVFGFLDDYAMPTSRPQNILRTLGVNLDIQRSIYSGYQRAHGFKAHILWLPIGLIGCVFVTEVRQNDNGVQNISGLSDYLRRLLRGCLTSARLFPAVFCDGIFAVLSTVVPRYVNPTPPQHLLNMRLNKFRQMNEHVNARHRQLFSLFAIPRYLMVYKKGVQVRRLCVVSFFIQNCYYCLQGNQSRVFGHTAPALQDYIPLGEILRPPPAVQLGDVWDFGNLGS